MNKHLNAPGCGQCGAVLLPHALQHPPTARTSANILQCPECRWAVASAAPWDAAAAWYEAGVRVESDLQTLTVQKLEDDLFAAHENKCWVSELPEGPELDRELKKYLLVKEACDLCTRKAGP